MAGQRGGGAKLAELTRLRQGAYRFLAALLLYPEWESFLVLPVAARELRRSSLPVSRMAFYSSWESLLREATGLLPSQLPRIQESYQTLFVGNTSQGPIPLCESAYIDPRVAPPGWVIAQVEKQYTSAGLTLLPRAEAPDHAAVELEFLSFLCGREAEGWEQGQQAQALESLKRQETFLEQHTGRWLSYLAQAVGGRDAQGLYGRVTEASWALAAHDADFVRALALSLKRKDKG